MSFWSSSRISADFRPSIQRRSARRAPYVTSGIALQAGGDPIHIYLVAPISGRNAAIGGTQTYTFALAKRLRKLESSVTIVGTGPPEESEGVAFASVAPRSVRSNIEFHRLLRAWVRRKHLESGAIIDAQRPDFLSPFLGLHDRPGLVCTLHGDPLLGVRSHRWFLFRTYRHLERLGLSAANRVISVSHSAMTSYIARYPFLTSKISTIPVGVDLGLFRPLNQAHERERLGLSENRVILYAGRLEPEKRVDVLFDAVATMENPPLLLVAGSGSLEASLKARAKGRPIRFLGNIVHDAMPRIIACADAVVLPSAFEGLPTIAVESLACGVPVIATPVGDLPLLIKPGKTGWLFDGKPETLKEILNAEIQHVRDFSEECIYTVRRFSWDIVAGQVMEVLHAAAG